MVYIFWGSGAAVLRAYPRCQRNSMSRLSGCLTVWTHRCLLQMISVMCPSDAPNFTVILGANVENLLCEVGHKVWRKEQVHPGKMYQVRLQANLTYRNVVAAYLLSSATWQRSGDFTSIRDGVPSQGSVYGLLWPHGCSLISIIVPCKLTHRAGANWRNSELVCCAASWTRSGSTTVHF